MVSWFIDCSHAEEEIETIHLTSAYIEASLSQCSRYILLQMNPPSAQEDAFIVFQGLV